MTNDPIIFMRPAWDTENAFCHQLADSLIAAGLPVEELGFGHRSIPTRPGIVFIHWPNEVFFFRRPRSAVHTLAQLAKLAWVKRRHGTRVVWLAHNVVPHDRGGHAFGVAREAFMRLLDGVIFLSNSSREQVLAAYPRLATLPSLVVPHGLYPAHGASAQPRAVPADRPVRLVFAGRVKRYKAPDTLANIVSTLPPGEVDLRIAGACDEPALAASLTAIAARMPNIAVELSFLSDGDLEGLLDWGDAVVLPYRDILNSGSALHALSRARPFIAPRLGSLIELQEQVGRNWVWLYDGELTTDTLAAAVCWLRDTPRVTGPDLSRFEWGSIGGRTANFLRSLE